MPTHFFHSGMAGAPTNTNAAGATLAIIDAILVTGFNLQSVLSATVASEVMTVTYAAPHLYEDKVLIRLDGAAGGSIVRRATVTGAQVLTIPAQGFADGAVAGTLSTRVAPADWERVFSDTGKAVFRSKATGPGCTRFYYRFSDSVAGSSKFILRGYEAMSDVDTGIGPYPTTGQVGGSGMRVIMSGTSTARPWVAVADGRTVYMHTCFDESAAYGMSFGDLSPFSGVDGFAAVAWAGELGQISRGLNMYLPRAASGVGSAIQSGLHLMFDASGASGRDYPSPIDGGMLLQRPVIGTDGGSASSSALRFACRGLMHCSANPVSGSPWVIFSSADGVGGRVLVVRDNGTSDAVAYAIDEDWP